MGKQARPDGRRRNQGALPKNTETISMARAAPRPVFSRRQRCGVGRQIFRPLAANNDVSRPDNSDNRAAVIFNPRKNYISPNATCLVEVRNKSHITILTPSSEIFIPTSNGFASTLIKPSYVTLMLCVTLYSRICRILDSYTDQMGFLSDIRWRRFFGVTQCIGISTFLLQPCIRYISDPYAYVTLNSYHMYELLLCTIW